MTDTHHHGGSKKGGSKKGHAEHKAKQRHWSAGLHKDWRVWVIALMLLAMVVYLLTMDESILPGGGEGPEVPAAVAE